MTLMDVFEEILDFIPKIFGDEEKNPTNPTICVECRSCTPDARCLAHPYPMEIDSVTGKRRRYATRLAPGVSVWQHEYTEEKYALCRYVNNWGHCRSWKPRDDDSKITFSQKAGLSSFKNRYDDCWP